MNTLTDNFQHHSAKAQAASPENDARVVIETAVYSALNRSTRESLEPITLTGGIVYLAASATIYFFPMGENWIVGFLLVMGVALLILFLALRQREISAEWANFWIAMIGVAGLFSCALLMWQIPDPRHTTSFMLLTIAAGALVLSTQWLFVVIVLTCLTWLALARNSPASPLWVHYGFALFVSILLATTIHFVRVRALRRLEIHRILDQARKDRLEIALLVVRLHEEEIRMLNEQLEQRVLERTAELRSSEERNRTLLNELNHVARVTTMGELAASIAHEVNQPLCAIINNASFCRRWLEKPSADFSEVRDAINDIGESGKHASEVIARVRNLFSKSDTETAEIEINEIILQVIALMRNEAQKRHVRIKTELSESLPTIRGDKIQLQQVILNLILNGFDAMNDVAKSERELLIQSQLRQSCELLIEVSDTGHGIDPQHLKRIFDAFYSTKPGGMGMGLSICQTIIRTHGGKLWAANGQRGAKFQFTLPTVQEGKDD